MAGNGNGNGNGALTAKQSAFVDEYLVDMNATAAALRAGYAKGSAHVTGCRLLKIAKVEHAIQAALNERATRTAITADRVLHELAAMAFANLGQYITVQQDGSAIVDLTQMTPAQAAAIQEITSEVYLDGTGADSVPVKKVRLKLHQRTRALELLGKHLGLFSDKVEHSGPDGGPLEVMDVSNLSTDTLKRLRAELKAKQADRQEG